MRNPAAGGAAGFLVLEAGLEPAQPQWPKDFKSFVSTIPPFEQLLRCQQPKGAAKLAFNF